MPCSFWAAMALPKNTQPNAGTATCVPWPSWPAACSFDPGATCMNLETPKKFSGLVHQAHQVAANYFRPISRKYDKAEHAYPKELDLLAALLDGMNAGSPDAIGAPSASKRGAAKSLEEGVKNG